LTQIKPCLGRIQIESLTHKGAPSREDPCESNSQKKLLKTIASRYQKACRKEHPKILDELCADFGDNQKYMTRKLLA